MMWLAFLGGALLAWAEPAPGDRITAAPTGPARARDGPISALAVAADADLFATCISAGLSNAAACDVVARLSEGRTQQAWRTASSLLAIGVDARSAWAPIEEIELLADLARAAQISERTGSALADAARRLAEDIRCRATDTAVARAERVGVLIALPLTLCFLPAFMILGLAPIVINLATTMIHQ